MSSGKQHLIDERFIKDGALTEFVTDAPFFDLESPMTPYEWAKLILLSPLALFRVLLSLVLLLSTWGFMKVVLIGAPTVTPFEPWREDLARNTIRFAGTCMLVLGTGGLARVQGWEHTADGEAQHAPVIFNHVSYLDALILAAYFAPCGVAKAGVATMPLVGTITRALQFLFVARRGTTDAVNAYTMVGDIREQVAAREVDRRFPRFMLAPEATTKPGHCLLKFSVGAFAPGVPVQPVLLGFRRNTRFNPGWGLDASTYWHFLRMMTQFKTHIDITVMPVYKPSAAEKADPRLYAENVRLLMAAHLGCSLSEYSTKEEFDLKISGLCVDWKYQNIVLQQSNGEAPILLSPIADMTAKKKA